MTRLAGYLLPTEKEPPSDAEAISHKLMVRAGLIRQVGAGLWTWLPAGWRVHQKVVGLIREELDGIGAQEMLMPVLQPAELWKRTGRAGIDELFKLKDRKGAELVLAMTHEEVVTSHVAQLVRSYRDLPLILYHFQVKERDEPRPRAGVLRTREFIMKDSYTFDRDAAGLAESYEKHVGAYDRIFERSGLRWYRVEADVGMMGGSGAHEYMAPCPAGENEIVLAPGYAANLEVASAEPQPVELPPGLAAPEPVATPGLKTVAEVSAAVGLGPGALLKAFPVIVEDRGLVLVIVRGDHRVNEIKLTNALGAPWRAARDEEIVALLGPPGFIGPVGIDDQVPIVLDEAVGPGGYVTGANTSDTHLRGVEPGRDFAFDRADVRSVEPGDLVDGHPIEIQPAIEVGNIFKLGTRYSAPLGARYLDEQGKEQLIWMG
ncbi:MAG: prolyl-tRNA synthetase, partial [Solirubrobacteraceae bacterium]|nr:prolyl-tRNA synthetase [Solirubrobacteraceae bacterium]